METPTGQSEIPLHERTEDQLAELILAAHTGKIGDEPGCISVDETIEIFNDSLPKEKAVTDIQKAYLIRSPVWGAQNIIKLQLEFIPENRRIEAHSELLRLTAEGGETQQSLERIESIMGTFERGEISELYTDIAKLAMTHITK